MGGFTHGNLQHIGKTIKNVSSYDFTSSYPAVMIAEKYPMSSPIPANIKTEQDFEDYLNTFCCMFECRFKNIRSNTY